MWALRHKETRPVAPRRLSVSMYSLPVRNLVASPSVRDWLLLFAT